MDERDRQEPTNPARPRGGAAVEPAGLREPLAAGAGGYRFAGRTGRRGCMASSNARHSPWWSPWQDGCVTLVEQYRYPIRRRLWELPMGTCEPGVSAAATAATELREETGLVAGQHRTSSRACFRALVIATRWDTFSWPPALQPGSAGARGQRAGHDLPCHPPAGYWRRWSRTGEHAGCREPGCAGAAAHPRPPVSDCSGL